MSSGVYPSCGYVLAATEKNLNKLGLTIEALTSLYIKEYGEEPSDKLSHEELFEDLANNETTFEFNKFKLEIFFVDDETYVNDGMETGWYFYFDIDELFTKKTTPLGTTLKLKNIFPVMRAWASCG